MKRISSYGLMLMAIAALSVTPSAWANCAFDSQPVGHTLGGFITDCPDALPIEGYIWLLANPSNPATPPFGNSNGQDFVCRFDGQNFPETLVDCTASAPGSGIAGDGVVTVYYEWAAQNPGAIGCPNPAQAGFAATPIGVHITCNNGATVLLEIGYNQDIKQYPLELASPADGTPISLSLANGGFANQPSVTSVSAGPSPSASNVCVNVPIPTVHSDCDAGSGGDGFSCHNPAEVNEQPRPAPQRGQLVTTNLLCDANPALAGPAVVWTPTTVQPDALGNACNVFSPAAGQCAYVGVRGQFGGVPAGGVIGHVRVGGPAASNDRVKIDNATTAQGKVKVAFSTTNETSIVGFNVYSDGTKLNGSLIGSNGVGNNAYVFEVGRGALKGGKTVLVEAVKNDGSVEKTAPVTLK
jgi:hypothetical protein